MSVLLPNFNVQPDISAIMICCVVALIVVSSDILAGSADGFILSNGVRKGRFWG